VREAHNLTGICEPIVYTMWDLNITQPYRLILPVTAIALPFLLLQLLLLLLLLLLSSSLTITVLKIRLILHELLGPVAQLNSHHHRSIDP
jgi:hypothetical protein